MGQFNLSYSPYPILYLLLIITYSINAPKTKSRQVNTQVSIAVRHLALGRLVVALERMLIITRSRNASKAILPVILPIGIKKETQLRITQMALGI